LKIEQIEFHQKKSDALHSSIWYTRLLTIIIHSFFLQAQFLILKEKNARITAPIYAKQIKQFGSVAFAFKTEKKKAKGRRIAASGVQCLTIPFHVSDKFASSTYFNTTRDKINNTPACAWPALNKFCLNGFCIKAGSLIKKFKRLAPP
jgi:hypothetical protein